MPHTEPAQVLKSEARNISMPPSYWQYAEKVAAEWRQLDQPNASTSGVIRKALRLMQTTRHDLASELQALNLLAEELRHEGIDRKEAAGIIRRCHERIVEIIKPTHPETAPAASNGLNDRPE